MSNALTCGSRLASSPCSGPRRATRESFQTPTHMWPLRRKPRPPNIFLSATPFRRARVVRMRAASDSSKATDPSFCARGPAPVGPFCRDGFEGATSVLDRPVTLRVCRPGVAQARETTRIGLDLDGVLDEQPAFFAFLTAALRSGGHFVAVLTYRDPESRTRTATQLA